MSVIRLIGRATALLAAIWLSEVGDAQASRWGCEVLLCASSSNPSWQAVPACHPPMQRLISAMSGWGFSWPTCPEAGTGKPGFERYGECPAGSAVGYADSDHGARGEPNLCVQAESNCGRGPGRREDCWRMSAMPRPQRAEPYYFDIPSEDGAVTRHWFNLRN